MTEFVVGVLLGMQVVFFRSHLRFRRRLMHTLDELVTLAAVVSAKVDTLISLEGTLTPDQQAKIDQVHQSLSDIAAKVDAVVAPPPPAPTP